MAIYPLLAIASAILVVALEFVFLRTGLFRRSSYWIALAIIFFFMVPVDGWLTKLSAPIVIYDPDEVSGLRPVWDILGEEFAYAFALVTLPLLCWEWLRIREEADDPAHDRADDRAADQAGDVVPR